MCPVCPPCNNFIVNSKVMKCKMCISKFHLVCAFTGYMIIVKNVKKHSTTASEVDIVVMKKEIECLTGELTLSKRLL